MNLIKLREDAERIVVNVGSYSTAAIEQARAVLSLLDAQSGMEEALKAAGKALEPFADHAGRYRGLTEGDGNLPLWDGGLAPDPLRLWHLRAARAALASVNAVLAGKNTEKPGASSNAATGQANLGRAAGYGRTGSATLPTGSLSTSALDEARALLEETQGTGVMTGTWQLRRDMLLARLSANRKGPKE